MTLVEALARAMEPSLWSSIDLNPERMAFAEGCSRRRAGVQMDRLRALGFVIVPDDATVERGMDVMVASDVEKIP